VIWVWGGINGVFSFSVALVSISAELLSTNGTALITGYFLDLCWAQAFGLVATPLSNELGIPGQAIHRQGTPRTDSIRGQDRGPINGIQHRSDDRSIHMGFAG